MISSSQVGSIWHVATSDALKMKSEEKGMQGQGC